MQVSSAQTAFVTGNGPLSIVICTKDRPDDLARAVASIRASSEAGWSAEIIVVEEGDSPRQIEGVRYVHLPRRGHGFGYARNVGLREAHGEVILFTDDDCEVERGWIEALIDPFRTDLEIVGVAGAVLVRGCNVIGYAENILGFPGGGLRYVHRAQGRATPTRFLSTCNCAYRRQALLEVGGFPEDARFGAEDSLAAERVNSLGRCVYTPNALVYHRARGRLGAIFRWFVRRGQSEIGYSRTTARPWQSAWYFIRSSWTVRMLGVALVLVQWPRLWALVPAALLLYYGALLWRFRFARVYPTHRRAWWVVPIVKVIMDQGTEVGRWKALLAR